MAGENVKVVLVKQDAVSMVTDIAFTIGGGILAAQVGLGVAKMIPEGVSLASKIGRYLAIGTSVIATEEITSQAASRSVKNVRELAKTAQIATTAALTGQVETVTPEQLEGMKA